MEGKKSGSSRRTKCGGSESGGDGGRDLWESGEEDGGNNREEIYGRFPCSFRLLRWRTNVFVIGVLEEIGRASACMEWGCEWWWRRRMMERKKSGSSRGTKCGSGGGGGDGGRDCGRVGKNMEERRGRRFAEDLLARSVFWAAASRRVARH
jgi:hypothetical protein